MLKHEGLHIIKKVRVLFEDLSEFIFIAHVRTSEYYNAGPAAEPPSCKPVPPAWDGLIINESGPTRQLQVFIIPPEFLKKNRKLFKRFKE